MEAMVITTDEESIIQNSSVNSGKYEKQKTSVEDRFFQTIKDYGGLAMSDLLISFDMDLLSIESFTS
jgi:hypothetical protein